jgi:hypothetical protein
LAPRIAIVLCKPYFHQSQPLLLFSISILSIPLSQFSHFSSEISNSS